MANVLGEVEAIRSAAEVADFSLARAEDDLRARYAEEYSGGPLASRKDIVRDIAIARALLLGILARVDALAVDVREGAL